jgi:aspartate-semialdehyde dehydrogenase
MGTMNRDFFYREKIPVGILGATGSVGQRFVQLLAEHPWFEIVAVAASDRSVGKRYCDAVNWLMSTPIPAAIGQMEVQKCDADLPGTILFSGLDAAVAGDIELACAKKDKVVVSNARNHRMADNVPLLVPEVNADHLELIKQQNYSKNGMIVTNPNCAAIGLVVGLKPLLDSFGIELVDVVTMQAVSGAGYPGVASLDVIDNIIPFINAENEKVETEPLKILGRLVNGHIQKAEMRIRAHCNRVPISDGHMEWISVRLREKASKSELEQLWRDFRGEAQEMGLPMSPQQLIHYFPEGPYPQPKLHRDLERGMAVSIGQLREHTPQDYSFTLLSHNTVRGAAGCAILNAEMLVKKGLIFW